MHIHRRSFLVSSVTGLGGLAVQLKPGPRDTGIVSGKRVFVIGGPGNIGTSTLEVLVENGNAVGLYTLPASYSEEWAKKLKFYLGGRNDSEKLQSAFDDFKPDYVIDFVLYRPEQASEILKIAHGKVQQYVFISTVDVNGYPAARIPQRETDPQVTTTNRYILAATTGRDLRPVLAIRGSGESAVLPEGARRVLGIGTAREAIKTAATGLAAWATADLFKNPRAADTPADHGRSTSSVQSIRKLGTPPPFAEGIWPDAAIPPWE